MVQYSPTNIISLELWVLRLKLVLLLTEILQNPLVLKKHDVFYTSTIPEVTWYEPLYNVSKWPFYILAVLLELEISLKCFELLECISRIRYQKLFCCQSRSSWDFLFRSTSSHDDLLYGVLIFAFLWFFSSLFRSKVTMF